MSIKPSTDPSCVLAFDWAEGAGNTVYDLSGKGNHGTIYGATRTRGKPRFALSFDGVDDYVLVPYSSSLNVYDTQQVTVLLWVKVIDDSADPYIYLLRRGNQYGVFWRSSDNTPYFQWQDSAGNFHYFLYAPMNLELNRWYHIAFGIAFDGTGKSYELINGAKVKEETITYDTKQDTTAVLEVVDIDYKGLIGSLRVFNRLLPPKESREHYYYGKKIFAQPEMFYHRKIAFKT